MTATAGATDGPVLIGTLEGDGDNADVYRQGGSFYAEITSIALGADDEEHVERTRSEAFSTLDALLKEAGGGLRFVPVDGG